MNELVLWWIILNVRFLWRERNQQDATNLMFIVKRLSQHVSGIVMPIFRRIKTVHYRIWCSALVVLAVVVWSWNASCVHCVKVTVRLCTVWRLLFDCALCEGYCSTVHCVRVTVRLCTVWRLLFDCALCEGYCSTVHCMKVTVRTVTFFQVLFINQHVPL